MIYHDARKKLLNTVARRIRPLRSMILLYSHQKTDIYTLSYQKSGRTWLRMMLAIVFSRLANDDSDAAAQHFAEYSKYVPSPGKRLKITYTHEDSRESRISGLERDKSRYGNKKVILLTRDPRDVMVSAYFEMTKRKSLDCPDISAFLRDEVHGVDKLIAYMNIWAENRHVPSAFLAVRYEDLIADTPLQLRRVLDFIGLPGVPDPFLEAAVESARFDRMQELEKSLAVTTPELRPGNPSDPESFKVRRGKVGGYEDYLGSTDIEYLNGQIRADLADFFACYKVA